MLRTPLPILLTIISATLLAIASTSSIAQSQPLPSGRTPVLVELFTSEGCSSCPSADALLARLQHDQPVPNSDIIVLEEHVDYWDSLGWHDRFSAHQFTNRQTQYVRRLRLDSPYTPQMIVDGTDQFTGNDTAHALRAITHAARTPKIALMLSALTFDGAHVAGEVSVTPSASSLAKSDLYAAVVESMASTQVQRGENGGRTLQHVSVVRVLQRIGRPADATATPLKFSLNTPRDTSSENLRVVVFIQRADQDAILGAISSPRGSAISSTTSVASTLSSLAR